jgi:hypothetical protein
MAKMLQTGGPDFALPDLDIPDYQLLHKIGAGGCGEVFVARNRHDGEFCAIKVVFPDRSDVELDAIRRYKNVVKDGQFLVQIQHVGKADTGPYYYVMPLADDANGPSVLRAPDQYKPLTLQLHRAAAGPLALDEALSIADCLLLALKELHAARLVHCDVKPANVLRVAGKWRLGDIGLLSPRELLNGSRGTRWFLAPEGPTDFKTDVYALGKTLLLLVTDSKWPDSNKAPDPLNDFIEGKLDIPGNDDRKEHVRQIILGACHRDPSKRSTVKALHEAVSRLLQTTTIVLNIVGIDYDSLDEGQLLRELAARLGLCILSARKKRGSVLVELALTPAQAEHLLTAANAGKLADLHVSGAWSLQSQKRLVELALTPAQAEHLLTAANAGKLADLHVCGAWKLQSQKRSEIHRAQETDVELDSIPIRESGRWVRWVLPVAACAAALLIIIWFTPSQMVKPASEMDRELASAKRTIARLEKELRDRDKFAGKVLILHGGGDKLQLWNIGDKLDARNILGVALSDQNNLLLTASNDKTARLWGLTACAGFLEKNLHEAEIVFWKAQVGQLAKEKANSEPLVALRIVDDLQHWQKDPDLAVVRDDKELDKLAGEQRANWQKFWTQVAALSKQARLAFSQTEHQGQLSDKEREQTVPLKMTAGKTYIIDMSSAQFDTYLRLEDDKGEVLAKNDSISPENLNSRIIFNCKEDGNYRIVATSFQQAGRGAFVLIIREFQNKR